jgi:putative peptide zinc metalloprotease protein
MIRRTERMSGLSDPRFGHATGMRRLLLALLGIVALTIGTSAPAGASGGEGNNLVKVENRESNSVRTKARSDVVEEAGTTVDNENVAFSYASCVDCRTVTAAIQVVVVENPAVNDYRPGNAAAAVNESCTRCATFAYARQVVLTPYRQIDLGEDAHHEIHDIQQEIRAEVESGDTFDAMSAALDALTERLVAVVQAEIDRTGSDAPKHSDRDVERDEH